VRATPMVTADNMIANPKTNSFFIVVYR